MGTKDQNKPKRAKLGNYQASDADWSQVVYISICMTHILGFWEFTLHQILYHLIYETVRSSLKVMSACNTLQLVLEEDQGGKAVELFDDMQWHRWTVHSKFSRRTVYYLAPSAGSHIICFQQYYRVCRSKNTIFGK